MKTSTFLSKNHCICVLICIIMSTYTHLNATEHKCGTFSISSFKEFHVKSAKGETVLASRPVISPQELTIASPSGKFLIHYTKYGNDS